MSAKLSYDYMKTSFERHSCVLLSTEYVNSNIKLDYICSCGNRSSIIFNSFQQGTRCMKCRQEKTKQTCLKKYGVEHPMQNTEVFEKNMKSGFRRKPIITPSGETIYTQGYEPQFYKQLLKTYTEDEIKHRSEDMPKIWYIGEDDKKHRYYPDFFIPKDNLIIEVKSTWTYKIKEQEISLKRQACLDAGYNFKLEII